MPRAHMCPQSNLTVAYTCGNPNPVLIFLFFEKIKGAQPRSTPLGFSASLRLAAASKPGAKAGR
ncbi:hypothetical protein, partial [Nitrospirillum viridazoti]|uniref:hypothetical protein n=1 Tax=Nitrospirillum viridazoti TaxID=3144925 RepID=UPI0019D6FA48